MRSRSLRDALRAGEKTTTWFACGRSQGQWQLKILTQTHAHLEAKRKREARTKDGDAAKRTWAARKHVHRRVARAVGAHENVLPNRRGVLQHEKHTRELSHGSWVCGNACAHLINTSEFEVSQP